MPAVLGQHFLTDGKSIKKIISLVPENRNILEIGPGRGALTGRLAEISGEVVCVEKDKLLAETLKKKYGGGKIKIINADILKTGTEVIKRAACSAGPFFIVSNLPFSITTDIMFWLLSSPLWEKCLLTIQKDAADRLLSETGDSLYGRTSVTVSAFFAPERKFNIRRECFQPKPSVDASVILLTNGNSGTDANDWKKFMNSCFFSKRKFLLSNLKRAGYKNPEKVFDKFSLVENLRPHQVSPEKYLALFKNLTR
ncbi:MAG: 16S rRNA (adenine(1518)-N(6)/adenine(1519)-N(6))-dimethyltransferase RsmA [bacterium]